MRLKYQLRGLGIGLIITTIILTISHNVREIEANSKTNIQPQESTGSILAFDKDAESSKTDNENGTEADSQSESETQTEPQQSQTEPQTAKQEEKPAESEQQTAGQETKPAETTAPTGNIVTVHIKDVYYARQAADILYNAGVITDKTGFVNYLDKAGYAERICEGTYQIKQGDSYETIARTICRIR